MYAYKYVRDGVIRRDTATGMYVRMHNICMYAYMDAYMYVRDGVIRRDTATGMYVTA